MMKAQSLILCATPRTGSTLLCDLLIGTEAAGRPASYYRQDDISYWAQRFNVSSDGATSGPGFDRDYLAAVKCEGENATGVFGLRLMWDSVADLSSRLDTLFPQQPDDSTRFELTFGQSLYVYLSRNDKIAQAVSGLKAAQTGLWHVASDGSERERVMPPQAPFYDADRISKLVAELEASEWAWNNWFAEQKIEPLRIAYEELSANPRAAVEQILSALGLDPARAAMAKPVSGKMADRESLRWIARYKAER